MLNEGREVVTYYYSGFLTSTGLVNGSRHTAQVISSGNDVSTYSKALRGDLASMGLCMGRCNIPGL